MTANEYIKSIQRDFDGIEKNLKEIEEPSDMLSAEEIDKMLKAVPPMYYPQVDGITPTVVAEPVNDDCISLLYLLLVY